jgi:hypothetical protein
MKNILATAALGVVLGLGGFGAGQAQNAPRVYENGPVWSISYIETKPGMFDDYMAYLNTSWKQSNEVQKKLGDVLSYKVLAINTPADHAPDVILMVEYKNMAVLDRSQAELDKQTAEVFGSVPRANQSQINRESLRALRGGLLARELVFAK